jgi:hypothetical protein
MIGHRPKRLIPWWPDAYVRIPSPELLAISLMFCAAGNRMLASMSETSWSDPGMDAAMSVLPAGTVTLLLADVEGSTRLRETRPTSD